MPSEALLVFMGLLGAYTAGSIVLLILAQANAARAMHHIAGISLNEDCQRL